MDNPSSPAGIFATKAATDIKASAHGAAAHFSEKTWYLTQSRDEGEGTTQKLRPQPFLIWVANICFTALYLLVRNSAHEN